MTPGLVVQHSRSGHPHRLAAWLRRRGIAYELHQSSRAPEPTDPTRFAWVATLGSVHSVHESEPEWIGQEIAFLRDAVAAGVPVLGICWGAQALAVALGAEVGPGPAEKGWVGIESSDAAIPAGPWLHYHTDVFAVPDGAVELARSPAGPSVFRHDRSLAVQFHPEADTAMAVGWARDDPAQTPESIAALERDGPVHDGPSAPLAEALFDNWYDTAVAGRVSGAGASRARPR